MILSMSSPCSRIPLEQPRHHRRDVCVISGIRSKYLTYFPTCDNSPFPAQPLRADNLKRPRQQRESLYASCLHLDEGLLLWPVVLRGLGAAVLSSLREIVLYVPSACILTYVRKTEPDDCACTECTFWYSVHSKSIVAAGQSQVVLIPHAAQTTFVFERTWRDKYVIYLGTQVMDEQPVV